MATPADPQALSECCSVVATGSCCSTPTPDTQRVDALDELKAQRTTAEVAALRSAGFRLLLDEGRPVETSEWAAVAGVDEHTVGEVLESHAGRVQLDDSGRLIGIAGLSVEPSRHELDIGDKTRWAWCALDAVGILGALEATGNIHSSDPRTGETVDIAFLDGRPQGEATLFILGGYDGGNVREEWCPLVNFFATRRDAEAWVADNDIDGDVVSVEQIADDAAAMWRPPHRSRRAPAGRMSLSRGCHKRE